MRESKSVGLVIAKVREIWRVRADSRNPRSTPSSSSAQSPGSLCSKLSAAHVLVVSKDASSSPAQFAETAQSTDVHKSLWEGNKLVLEYKKTV